MFGRAYSTNPYCMYHVMKHLLFILWIYCIVSQQNDLIASDAFNTFVRPQGYTQCVWSEKLNVYITCKYNRTQTLLNISYRIYNKSVQCSQEVQTR